MRAQSGISRRHMLAMTAAATGLSIGGNLGGALAQSGKRIERFAPEPVETPMRWDQLAHVALSRMVSRRLYVTARLVGIFLARG